MWRELRGGDSNIWFYPVVVKKVPKQGPKLEAWRLGEAGSGVETAGG
jgi:hypothetical protein